MTTQRACLWQVRMLLVALVAPSVGCGMTDYEAKLKDERTRNKARDEWHRQLGDPLDMPTTPLPDGSQPALAAITFFLRPPKEFGCKPQSVGVIGQGKLVHLYGYPGSDHHLALAGALPDMSAELFKNDVWQALLSHLEVRWPALVLPTEPDGKRTEERTPPAIGKETPQPLKFEVWRLDIAGVPAGKNDGKTTATDKDKGLPQDKEPVRYLLFFHHHSAGHVAVVFVVPQASEVAARKGIDASVKSLAVGDDANQARAAWMKWK